MKNFTLTLFFLLAFLSFRSEADAACNWKSQVSGFSVSDTCKTGFGSITLKNVNCTYLVWSVNGTVRTQGKGISGYTSISFPITANGTYNICVKVYDTCNKCDTTICSAITISCFSTCKWKSKISNFYSWDSCYGSGARNSVNAYIAFNTGGCYKYYWTVNNVAAGKGNVMNYKISANGTYNVCVKVTDTCNKCDTTLCSTRTISCFSTCNWKSRSPNIYFTDTCKGKGLRNTIHGYISFNTGSCYKYSWTVNGVPASTSTGYPFWLVHNVTQNGTYTVCVKVTDTCNKCDTTYCATKTFSCFSGCNWKSLKPALFAYDSCNGSVNKIMTGISFNDYYSGKYKHLWTMNGAVVGNNGAVQQLSVSSNGTYTICVKSYDTINKCDTTICMTVTMNCISSCNWKNKISNFYAWDTCKGSGARNSVNAYIAFKTGGCFKYQWKVNNNPAGNSNIMNYRITSNGTYNICVKVTDTCNNCDTILCSSKTISCFTNPCNWSSKIKNFYAWDTCKGAGARNSVNAYIALNTGGCFKYQWTVNGAAAGKGNVLNYKISSNGNYYICLKVTDTCNNCDTTLCAKRIITCYNICNFKARGFNFKTLDTCISNNSIIKGYINFNKTACLKYLWTVAGVAVGTGQSINTSIYKNGTYVVCVKVTDTCTNNRCDTTFCSTLTINCNSLGLSKQTINIDNIRIYPNPVKDILNIDWTGEKIQVEVVNILGELLYNGMLTADKNTINTGNWADGIYLVRIKSEKDSKVFKIVVNR